MGKQAVCPQNKPLEGTGERDQVSMDCKAAVINCEERDQVAIDYGERDQVIIDCGGSAVDYKNKCAKYELVIFKQTVQKALKKVVKKQTSAKENKMYLEKINHALASYIDFGKKDMLGKLKDALGVKVKTKLEKLEKAIYIKEIFVV